MVVKKWLKQVLLNLLDKFVLEQGARVNDLDIENSTALMKSTLFNKRASVSKMLIDVDKSNLNFIDDEGKTALIWSSVNNSKEVVQVFLDAGADSSIRDKNGRTAMDYLIRNSSFKANGDGD